MVEFRTLKKLAQNILLVSFFTMVFHVPQRRTKAKHFSDFFCPSFSYCFLTLEYLQSHPSHEPRIQIGLPIKNGTRSSIGIFEMECIVMTKSSSPDSATSSCVTLNKLLYLSMSILPIHKVVIMKVASSQNCREDQAR